MKNVINEFPSDQYADLYSDVKKDNLNDFSFED
ncbi:hypothetical protein GIHI108528_15205 [Gillisia hiemivivida]